MEGNTNASQVGNYNLPHQYWLKLSGSPGSGLRQVSGFFTRI
jgi:hypothetical protein